MKLIINKLVGWILISNRKKYALCGLIIYASMITICLIVGITWIASSIVSLLATTIAAASVDYKDKLYGNKFDWLDVAATVLLPGVITLIILILNCIL